MEQSIHVVVMAGGSGTRFWPYSRNAKPKQFLDILGMGRSLLQMTFDRFQELVPASNIWVVSNKIYKDLIAEQLPELDDQQILMEPSKKNTAPCIAYATYKIRQKDPNAVVVVTPSDAAIFDTRRYLEVIQLATRSAASDDRLITIGIKPTKPETGYGYIQYFESEEEVKKVKTFTEKPDVELAEKFIESGDFVWNAGIFVWSVKSIVGAMEQLQPWLAEAFDQGADVYFSEDEGSFVDRTYNNCKSISIDYAIMEKAENVYMIPGDFGWSDLGSWDALYEIKDKDKNGNVLEQKALLYDCKSNYIKSSKGKLVVASDLEGYLIADFDDVLLICKKDDATRFKNFVNEVKAEVSGKFI
jgi:mannose-1-phosphate guanylyltransferase